MKEAKEVFKRVHKGSSLVLFDGIYKIIVKKVYVNGVVVGRKSTHENNWFVPKRHYETLGQLRKYVSDNPQHLGELKL